MIAAFLSIIAVFLAPEASAVLNGDLNCTTYNGTAFVYSPAATICPNAISDQACAVLYPPDAAGAPAPGTDNSRPVACYTTAAATPAAIVQDMKNAATQNCPKACGFCCQTSAYNCRNAQYPSMNCATITQSQCMSPTWRPIIARECPASCGFCNDGGCVDAVPDCANDLTICGATAMQNFVNTNCQKTCARCASSTVTSVTSATCTTFIADSSTTCTSWAANGFCTNTFYTLAQRRSYCARTCRIC